jgi:hypothetical protein
LQYPLLSLLMILVSNSVSAVISKDTLTTTDEDDVHSVDLLRDTEVHFGGETTLDNGLTVGAHIEASC